MITFPNDTVIVNLLQIEWGSIFRCIMMWCISRPSVCEAFSYFEHMVFDTCVHVWANTQTPVMVMQKLIRWPWIFVHSHWQFSRMVRVYYLYFNQNPPHTLNIQPEHEDLDIIFQHCARRSEQIWTGSLAWLSRCSVQWKLLRRPVAKESTHPFNPQYLKE